MTNGLELVAGEKYNIRVKSEPPNPNEPVSAQYVGERWGQAYFVLNEDYVAIAKNSSDLSLVDGVISSKGNFYWAQRKNLQGDERHDLISLIKKLDSIEIKTK